MKHVVRDCLGKGRWFLIKNEGRIWINEVADQPCGADPVNFRARTGYPSPFSILPRVQGWTSTFILGLVMLFCLFKQQSGIVRMGRIEVINVPDFQVTMTEFIQGNGVDRVFAPCFCQLAKFFGNLAVIVCSGFVEKGLDGVMAEALDGSDVNHRCFSSACVDLFKKPLESLGVSGCVWEQIAGGF